MPEKRHKSGFRGPSPDVGKATQFKPGNNANPGGRPKRKIITELYLQSLNEICESDKAKRTYAQILVANMVSRALKGVDAVRAVKEITDRVEGKARPSEEESEALKTQRTFVIAMPKRAAK